MNSGMEAGGGRRLPTPIPTEDPVVVTYSLADPAITERRNYLYVAQASLGPGPVENRPPTIQYDDEEPISLLNVPVYTNRIPHTLIASPEVMRRMEETKRERLAAEAEEAATGIKRPQERGVWFSDETLVIGDPSSELLHYVKSPDPVAHGTKIQVDGGGPVLKRHCEDPNCAAADSPKSGSGNN